MVKITRVPWHCATYGFQIRCETYHLQSTDRVGWHWCAVSDMISGVVSSDGCCRIPHCEVRDRAGWGFSMFVRVVGVTAAASGPVPFSLDDV
eukprot:7903205-Pyramimonas_sp.AAC.1